MLLPLSSSVAAPRSRKRFPIPGKFAVMLVVLVAALLAVGYSGIRGLSALSSRVDSLYGDHIVTLQRTTRLADDSAKAHKLALEIIASNNAIDIRELETQLNTAVAPAVSGDIDALQAVHAKDGPTERGQIAQIASAWGRFLALPRPLDTVVATTAAQHDDALGRRVRAIFAPIEALTERQTRLETAQAAAEARRASSTFHDSRTLVILISVVATLVGALVVVWLIRDVVPRIRRYSSFASRVAAGEADRVVAVNGSDELSELGSSLNEMVNRRVTELTREGAQSEFAEVMQLAETEEEAHDLLKRQIERLVPASDVVMLNRNNSADRLQATTPVADGSALAGNLENAKPRACLAVRFARTHGERSDRDPLVSCEVCGKAADFSTCEPLLVGGEVIGSVLTTHAEPLADGDAQSIKQSVTQAAPVLGNLRNLAIAERRAETDSLTGLPNNRNVADTVKRMAAHASRTVTPLAALAIDLDHFKQINDSYGHGSGDEVLAAVGAALRSASRDADFVGRAGGEEFLILLPDTSLDGAQTLAEKIRLAVAGVTIPTIQRPITASIGVAVIPDHAGDANSLLRHADRALYTAKSNGRNRVETFTREMIPSDNGEADQSSMRDGIAS